MLQMIILYAILLIAVLCDFLWCRIPNYLILIGFVLGIVFCIWSDPYWYFYIIDGLFVFAICYSLFLIGAFGGGDVKLLMVIALFLGFEKTMNIAILAIGFGAIISIFKLIYQLKREKDLKISRLYIHFSFPIFLGVIFTQLLGGQYIWTMF